VTSILDRNLAALRTHGYATPEQPRLPSGWQLDLATSTPALDVPGAAGRLISLHSRRDPAAEAARLVAAAGPSDAHAVAVVAGVGLGFVVEALEQQQPSLPIVLADTSFDRLVPCLSRRDWTPYIAGGQLGVFSPDVAADSGGLRRLLEARDGTLLVVPHPVLSRETGGDLASTLSAFNRAWLGARANREARLRFERPYYENTLANLWRLEAIDDVRNLAGSERGRAAMVVAAGPSLDRQLPEIARARESAVLVAVDTALRPLLAAGLDPDFVVAVDLSETNARHLLDLASRTTARLVGELSLPPMLLDAFGDRALAYRVGLNEPWPWLVAHGVEVGVLAAWGSVLVTTIDFACHLGADPVLLCGADLAYTGNRPYCRGTTFGTDAAARGDSEEVLAEQWMSARGPDLLTMADLDGEPTRVPTHFLAVRDAIVDLATKRRGQRIVNVTGAGILAGGAIEQGTIAHAIDAQPRPRGERPHSLGTSRSPRLPGRRSPGEVGRGKGRDERPHSTTARRSAIRLAWSERAPAWRRLVAALHDAWPHFDPSRDNHAFDSTALRTMLRALAIAANARGTTLLVSDDAFIAEMAPLLNSPWTPERLRFVQALTIVAPSWFERFEGVLSRTAADGRTDVVPYFQSALWAMRTYGDGLYLPSPVTAMSRAVDGLASMRLPERLTLDVAAERTLMLAHVGRADEAFGMVDTLGREPLKRPLGQQVLQALWIGGRARTLISGRRGPDPAIAAVTRAWVEREIASGRDAAIMFALLTRIAIAAGEIDQARRHLTAGLERYPTLRYACQGLAVEGWDSGRPAWAKELLGLAELPARRTAPLLFHRAVAMALVGDGHEARDLFDRLDRAWPTFFGLTDLPNNRWFNLAQAATALGDDELARRARAAGERFDPLWRYREQVSPPPARRPDGSGSSLPAFSLPEPGAWSPEPEEGIAR
jgi:hypothetical protein